MTPSISFVIATIGRASIAKTLDSIECWDGDEIVVVGGQIDVPGHLDRKPIRYLPHPPGNDWGHSERNYAAAFLGGHYVAHIDDDDVYLPGHRQLMADAIEQAPNRPSIFRMQYPNGTVLWSGYKLELGNVGTPMTLWPNEPHNFGTWGSFHGGDFHFVQTCLWPADAYNWRPDIIVKLGHD